ncbi:MAG: response regulator transcription factor [Alphaproteobacteria bacterium]
MHSGLIILAEDDDKLRKLYSDYLGHQGFTIVAAKNGAEVLPLLHNLTPSILILDIMMPKMDGIEACRQARKIIGADVPVIFLTASDALDRLHECMAAGGDDYLIKSSKLNVLLQRVIHWTRATSRSETKRRRAEVLKEIKAAVENAKLDADHGHDLTADSDDMVRQMSEFIAAARSAAPEKFGGTVEEKRFLLGYATGVADHWSENAATIRPRFMAYLRAVLAESNLLTQEEISQMLGAFAELSAERLFKTARIRGQYDCLEAENQGSEFIPTGLAKFAQSAAA